MINAEDLRIGDIVQTNKDSWFPKDTLCIVSVILPDRQYNGKKGAVFLKNVNDDNGDPWLFWCCNIDGVPITLELLEKSGFKEEQHQKYDTSEWYDFYHCDLGINIVYEVEENKFAAYLDGKKLREIQYAHELQHILWVLGLNAELKV